MDMISIDKLSKSIMNFLNSLLHEKRDLFDKSRYNKI